MSETVLTPDLVAQVAALQRAVYELERSRLPQGSGTVPTGVDSLDPLVFRRDDAVNVGNEYLAVVFTDTFGGSNTEAATIVAWGDPSGPDGEPYLDCYIENAVFDTTNGWQLYAQGAPFTNFTDFFWDGRRSGSDHSVAEFGWSARPSVGTSQWALGTMLTKASAAGFTAAELALEIRVTPFGPGNFGDFDVRFTLSDELFLLLLDYEFQDGSSTQFHFADNGSGPVFAIFDGAAVSQAAAVSVGGQTAAVQAVYNALRAYGWFAA